MDEFDESFLAKRKPVLGARAVPKSYQDLIWEIECALNIPYSIRDSFPVMVWKRDKIVEELDELIKAELIEMHEELFKNIDPNIPAWTLFEKHASSVRRLEESDEYFTEFYAEEIAALKEQKDLMKEKVSQARLAQTQTDKPEDERMKVSNAEKQKTYREKVKAERMSLGEEAKEKLTPEEQVVARRKAKAECEKRRRAEKKAAGASGTVQSDD